MRKNTAFLAALLLAASALNAQQGQSTWKTQGQALATEGRIRIRMKITRSSPKETIMAPQLLILDGSHATLSIGGELFASSKNKAPGGQDPRSQEYKKTFELLRDKNFWQGPGRKSEHDLSRDQKRALEEIASDSATPAWARLRAGKLLCDLNKQVRVHQDISQADASRAIAEAFAHIEADLQNEAVSGFAPQRGFSHLSVSRRKNDPKAIWVLLESTGSARPAAGLNLRLDPTVWQVTKTESWGQPRGDALRIDVVKAVGEDKVLALISIFQEGKVVHCESKAFQVEKSEASGSGPSARE